MELHAHNILDIPVRLLQEITLLLDVTDILTCTRVCKRFWEAIDRDSFWHKLCKRFCNQYAIDYVNTVPSTVEPVYSPPQEILASVCEWRRVYMRLMQLKRNFVNFVHKSHLLPSVPDVCCSNLVLVNDLMIIANSLNTKLEVLSTRTKPRPLAYIIGSLKNIEAVLHIADDNTIVIVQNTLLQWCKINVESEESTSIYRRLVNGNNNGDIPETENIHLWYHNTQPNPDYVMSCVTGKYFICVVRLNNQIMLYQWNLETGIKVCELNVVDKYEHDGHVYCVYFPLATLTAPVTYSGDVLLVLHRSSMHEHERCHIMRVIFSYNVETHLYKFLITDNNDSDWPIIYYEKNRIVIIDRLQRGLTFYNLDPESITTDISIHCKRSYSFKEFKMRGNVISFVLGTRLILKNNNFEHLYHVSLTKNSMFTKVSHFLCDWNIVLVSFSDIIQTTALIELHDFRTKSCINTFRYDAFVIYLCSSLKVFVKSADIREDHIHMLKFW